MGVDITLHAEIKLSKTGKWHNYGTYNPTRYYRVFNWMAGIRGPYADIEPLKPKGLPDDMSEVTRLAAEHNAGDVHAGSWLSSAEVEGLMAHIAAEINDVLGDNCGAAMESWMTGTRKPNPWTGPWAYLFNNGWHTTSLPEGATDFRFVFWFDGC